MESKLEPGDLLICHPDDYLDLMGRAAGAGLHIRSSPYVPRGKSLHVKAAARQLPAAPPLPRTVAEWDAQFPQPAAREWFHLLLASGVPLLVAAQKVLERLCGMDQPESPDGP